jgi:hypothetical protein
VGKRKYQPDDRLEAYAARPKRLYDEVFDDTDSWWEQVAILQCPPFSGSMHNHGGSPENEKAAALLFVPPRRRSLPLGGPTNRSDSRA